MRRFFALVAISMAILLTGCQTEKATGYKTEIFGVEVWRVTPLAPPAPAPVLCPDGGVKGETYPGIWQENGRKAMIHRDAVTCQYSVVEYLDAPPAPAPTAPVPVQARQVAAPVTQVSAKPAVPACPTSPAQAAALAGGNATAWSLLPGSDGTGWHYDGAATKLTAPTFGKLDAPDGTFRNGQATTTTVATFWCNG